jgi:hypothetical protein
MTSARRPDAAAGPGPDGVGMNGLGSVGVTGSAGVRRGAVASSANRAPQPVQKGTSSLRGRPHVVQKLITTRLR